MTNLDNLCNTETLNVYHQKWSSLYVSLYIYRKGEVSVIIIIIICTCIYIC